MSYLAGHWSFDPFLIIALVLVGLARGRPCPAGQPVAPRAHQGTAAAVAVVLRRAGRAADRGRVAAGLLGGQLLLRAHDPAPAADVRRPRADRGRARRGSRCSTGCRAGWARTLRSRSWPRGWSRPIRAVAGFALRPWTTVIAFNLVMVFWHLPGPYDLAAQNQAVHIWLMHGSFFVVGVLFWLQFIPSAPFRTKFSRPAQMAALVFTNVAMWVLAMSMSILANASWYSVYAHVRGVSLPPFDDQQIGAAILWVCGDFWAVPGHGLRGAEADRRGRRRQLGGRPDAGARPFARIPVGRAPVTVK